MAAATAAAAVRVECPCSKSELSVFDDVRVQVATEKGQWQTILPIGSLDNQGSITCLVSGSSNSAIDLNNISMYVAFKVLKADGTNLAADAPVAPINNLLYSMFRDIQLQLNGQVVTRGSYEFPYKTYLQLMTEFDWAKQGEDLDQGACIGFYPDTPGNADKAYNDAAEANKNKGAAVRRGWISESKLCELRGPVMLDINRQHLYLMPGIDMQFTFHKSDPRFYLQDKSANPADYKVKFVDFKLFVRRVQLADFAIKEIRDEWSSRDAVYPFLRKEVVTLSIAQGLTSFVQENLFRGLLPNDIKVMIVSNVAAQGDSIAHNPYNLQHYNLAEIGMFEDADAIAMEPLKVNFDENQYLNAYYALMESIGAIGERAIHTPITKKAFAKGSTIFCFTRSPDLSYGDAALPSKMGNISLRLNFRQALPEPVTVIVMATFDSRIQINKNGAITTDYPV